MASRRNLHHHPDAMVHPTSSQSSPCVIPSLFTMTRQTLADHAVISWEVLRVVALVFARVSTADSPKGNPSQDRQISRRNKSPRDGLAVVNLDMLCGQCWCPHRSSTTAKEVQHWAVSPHDITARDNQHSLALECIAVAVLS